MLEAKVIFPVLDDIGLEETPPVPKPNELLLVPDGSRVVESCPVLEVDATFDWIDGVGCCG